jgi:hypothetical protein
MTATEITNLRNALRLAESAAALALDERDRLTRENDELLTALSGRTVSCSRCNEAGYKLAGFEAEVAGLRAENEDLRDEARNALRLASENERLHAHLDELTASTIHSCGDHCQRPNCVRRREMAAMREAIREAVSLLEAVDTGAQKDVVGVNWYDARKITLAKLREFID